MSLKFKTDEVRDEYTQLGPKNSRLVDLIIELVDFCQKTYGKDVVLTDVHRTEQEEADLYHTTPDKAPKSAHYTWEAVDIRSFIYTQAEIDAICKHLNGMYKNVNKKPVAFCHAIPGGAYHFHVQLYR